MCGVEGAYGRGMGFFVIICKWTSRQVLWQASPSIFLLQPTAGTRVGLLRPTSRDLASWQRSQFMHSLTALIWIQLCGHLCGLSLWARLCAKKVVLHYDLQTNFLSVPPGHKCFLRGNGHKVSCSLFYETTLAWLLGTPLANPQRERGGERLRQMGVGKKRDPEPEWSISHQKQLVVQNKIPEKLRSASFSVFFWNCIPCQILGRTGVGDRVHAFHAAGPKINPWHVQLKMLQWSGCERLTRSLRSWITAANHGRRHTLTRMDHWLWLRLRRRRAVSTLEQHSPQAKHLQVSIIWILKK